MSPSKGANTLPTNTRRKPLPPLLLCAIFLAPAHARACDRLPLGQSAWVRLLAPVSTYSAHPGDPIQGVLTRPLACDGTTVLPMGTNVQGTVLARKRVGWGFGHETASLELGFTRATLADGSPTPFSARVEDVLNAREVVRRGVIQGVLSSNTFQGRISGHLAHLPTLNPYSDATLLIFKLIFPIFPEPEVYLPAGTDLRLRTTAALDAPLPDDAPEFEAADFDTEQPAPQDSLADAGDTSAPDPASESTPDTPELDAWVKTLPTRVTSYAQGDGPADFINLAFVGTPDQLTSAFHAAGYNGADPLSARALLREMYVLLNNSNYPTGPMRTFYLDGHPQDMSWQKSLDSYDRRDHLRIWRWHMRKPGESVWLSSSTHDSQASMSLRYHRFIHHIDSDLDAERAQIISDLNFAGCLRSVTYVPRPDVPTSTRNATGDLMRTDGALAVLHLQPCAASGPSPALLHAVYRPGNHFFRFCRREVLTVRSDFIRANVFYASYSAARMAYSSMRRPEAEASVVSLR